MKKQIDFKEIDINDFEEILFVKCVRKIFAKMN